MKQVYPLALASIFILSACTKERITGTGSIKTEQRSARNFTSVHVSGTSEVIVNQSPYYSVQVRGYSNLLPYFETRVVNGTLELYYSNNVSVSHDNIQVIVNLPVLTGLSIAGSSNIQALGNFTSSGAIQTTVSGSGNILIERGVTDYFYASISGSGNIHAFGMLSRKAEVNSSGSGNIEISTADELAVRISGSGNVYYKGNPYITSQITGSGTVIKR